LVGLWFSGGGVNSDGLWDSLGLLLDGGQGRGWDVVVGGNGRLLLGGNSGGWSWSWGDLEVDDQWRIDVVRVVGRGVLFLDVFVADWRLVFDFADEDFGRAGLCFGGGFDGSSRGGSSLFRCSQPAELEPQLQAFPVQVASSCSRGDDDEYTGGDTEQLREGVVQGKLDFELVVLCLLFRLRLGGGGNWLSVGLFGLLWLRLSLSSTFLLLLGTAKELGEEKAEELLSSLLFGFLLTRCWRSCCSRMACDRPRDVAVRSLPRGDVGVRPVRGASARLRVVVAVVPVNALRTGRRMMEPSGSCSRMWVLLLVDSSAGAWRCCCGCC
jgi:hypothetical protein